MLYLNCGCLRKELTKELNLTLTNVVFELIISLLLAIERQNLTLTNVVFEYNIYSA